MYLTNFILFIFINIILYYELNSQRYIRRALKLSNVKSYKLIDCFQCQAFWITLLFSWNIYLAMSIYITLYITNQHKNDY